MSDRQHNEDRTGDEFEDDDMSDEATETDGSVRADGQPHRETDRLTPREAEFALTYVMSGGDASAAYRQAYTAGGMTAKNISNEAYIVRQRPRVAARIAELQAAARRLSEESLLDYLLELHDLKVRCLDAGSMGAAVKVTELKGKAQGRFIEHLKLESGEDPTEILEALRGQIPGEVFTKIAALLGFADGASAAAGRLN